MHISETKELLSRGIAMQLAMQPAHNKHMHYLRASCRQTTYSSALERATETVFNVLP